MYRIGTLIVYGNTGVCRVENITTSEEIPALRCLQAGQSYYILQPLYQTETIYAPVDNPKVFMRDVISKEKAETLIRHIPEVRARTLLSCQAQDLKEYYEAAIRTHDCEDLIELTMSVYAKKQYLEQQSRKFCQVDERYMKWAEEMLYGEFAVALGIPKEDIPSFIAAENLNAAT